MEDPIRKAGALIIAEKRLLIVRPYNKPFFINPGGRYKGDETCLGCLERELKEELDVGVRSYQHYRTYDIERAATSDRPLILELYFVNIIGTPKPHCEIEVIEWLSRTDFLNKRFNLAPSFDVFMPDLMKDNYL